MPSKWSSSCNTEAEIEGDEAAADARWCDVGAADERRGAAERDTAKREAGSREERVESSAGSSAAERCRKRTRRHVEYRAAHTHADHRAPLTRARCSPRPRAAARGARAGWRRDGRGRGARALRLVLTHVHLSGATRLGWLRLDLEAQHVLEHRHVEAGGIGQEALQRWRFPVDWITVMQWCAVTREDYWELRVSGKPGGVSLRAEHECDEDAREWRENGELVDRVEFGQVVRENCGDGVRLRPGETVQDLTHDLSGMHKMSNPWVSPYWITVLVLVECG